MFIVFFSILARRHSSSMGAEEVGQEEAEKEAREDVEESDNVAVEEAADATD